jgi:hypothetical protein
MGLGIGLGGGITNKKIEPSSEPSLINNFNLI